MTKKKRRGKLDYAIIFGAGLVWDAILSVDTIVTANFSSLGAVLTTVTVTLLSYFMYDRIIDEMGINWKKVWTLALGSGVGAGLTTELLKHLYR